MASLGDMVFWLSITGLLVLALWNFIRYRKVKQIALSIFLLSICAGIYGTLFHSGAAVRAKGEQAPEWPFVVILYVCMIIGMALSYLYNLYSAPKAARQPFDIGNFLAPVFASPIVFIPLLSAFQGSGVDLANLTSAKLVIFLVGVQNGFFWKELFEKRRKEQGS